MTSCADHELCAGRLSRFIVACWVISGLADSALYDALTTHYPSTDLQARSARIAYPSRIPREKAAREKARRRYGVTCRSARTKQVPSRLLLPITSIPFTLGKISTAKLALPHIRTRVYKCQWVGSEP